MPKLKIDELEIEVPKGTKVIVAAERLGIMIPRFCYHPGLGSVGACRLCAVKFVEGPVKGIQMSCMVDAQDGMIVSTTDEEAVDFRKHVIEWLMMNHPHDCPVCDEGGHCFLQDMTVSGGHGIRRYLGKKWTYRDQYLGPFVQHEMNRCIHCWRCRRFYQDFAGYRDLGAMQISYRTYFGRYKDGPLESPFAGNLIDICPTGVYTDKPSRFKGRRWDYQRAPSICIHCSLGCHTTPSARYREIMRLEARFSETVNGYFICDRGRYGFDYTNHTERPRQARIGKEEVPLAQALHAVRERLEQIKKTNFSGSIASLGSTRGSLETQGMLKRLCRSKGWQEPIYFEESSTATKVDKAISRLDSDLAISLREVEKADFILAIGADPLHEAPMLSLAMRQAYRNGATIGVIDPRPISLPFPFLHIPSAPKDMDLYVSLLIKGVLDRPSVESLGQEALTFYDKIPEEYTLDPLFREAFTTLGQKLQNCRRPVLVCGLDIVRLTTPDLVADHALLLKKIKERIGLFYLLPGPNAFGAALFSPHDGSLRNILDGIEKRMIKALILVETDPFSLFPDQGRLKEALEKLDFVLVIDYLPSRVVDYAHIFLPSRTPFETTSSFINQEGRLQLAAPVHAGGIPLSQISSGDHPPRLFHKEIPGGEPKAAWEILGELADEISFSGDNLWLWMANENPVFANHPEGVRVSSGKKNGHSFSLDGLMEREGDWSLHDEFELLLVDWTFGTEELSNYSRPVRQVEKDPFLLIHRKDAERLGLQSSDQIVLHLDGGSLEVRLEVQEKMAPGVLILPKHRQLSWQKIKTLPAMVLANRIKKKQ
jgi:NADH-quinone oxidoreductase subunit G